MIPIIKNLKQIQEKLRNTIKPRSFTDFDSSGHKAEEEIKKQTKIFIDILEEYKLEYKGIDDLKKCLIYGGIITLFFLILIFLFNSKNVIELQSFTILITFFIEIAILINHTLQTYIPSPYKITEWSYMKEYFNLSPSSLAKCANLKLDYNPKDELSFGNDWNPKIKRSLKIYSDIELRGYKYWIFIYDYSKNKLIFNITGNINKKTRLAELMPDTEFNGWYINISEFDAYKYKDNKNIEILFFVFDPILYGNYGYPYFGHQKFEFDEEISFSTGNRLGLYNGTFGHIIYSGKDLDFKKMEWRGEIITKKEEDKIIFGFIKEIFEISKKDIMKVRNTCSII